ncbi:uncharacterized protein METZ01_LOCUS89728 [marine metagenome]|uniref:Uncharacterized protein n=1 Tax=marine metagenome TaxID=408172 RepID=A0A381V9P7_9ZZZZ
MQLYVAYNFFFVKTSTMIKKTTYKSTHSHVHAG